jgi:hypothetical protein
MRKKKISKQTTILNPPFIVPQNYRSNPKFTFMKSKLNSKKLTKIKSISRIQNWFSKTKKIQNKEIITLEMILHAAISCQTRNERPSSFSTASTFYDAEYLPARKGILADITTM